MLIAITKRIEYVDYQFDLTFKCIKVIYTSHLFFFFPLIVFSWKNNTQGLFSA